MIVIVVKILGRRLKVLLVFALIHFFYDGAWFHLELTAHSSRQ